MLLILGELIFFIIKLILNLCFYILKTIYNILIIILKNEFLRVPFLIFSIGFFLKTNFIILSTIYFLYLMHLCALKFNIYKKIHLDFKYIYNKFISSYKISNSLKGLKKENIVLRNISLEDNEDGHCLIDNLVITTNGLFIIKSLTSSYNDYIDYIDSIKSIDKSNKNTNDLIIDNTLLYKISEECLTCYNILRNILSPDIPITNVIALPQDNSVVISDNNISIPVVVSKDLSYFIKKNSTSTSKYSPTILKTTLLQNKVWPFDIFLSKFNSFFIHSKLIILFFIIFFILYKIYITTVSYFFFKLY